MLGESMDAFAEETWDKWNRSWFRTGIHRDERTTTEELIDALVRDHPGHVAATRLGMREHVTGADLEIWIKDRSRAIGLLVQAKSMKSTNGGQYERLDHKTTSGADQATALIGAAKDRSMHPLYFFYSGGGPSFPKGPCGLDRGLKTRGVMVSSAEHAKSLAAAGDTASVAAVNAQAVPWGCLVLCPGNQDQENLADKVRKVLDIYAGPMPNESKVLEWNDVSAGVRAAFDRNRAFSEEGEIEQLPVDAEFQALAADISTAEYLILIDASPE